MREYALQMSPSTQLNRSFTSSKLNNIEAFVWLYCAKWRRNIEKNLCFQKVTGCLRCSPCSGAEVLPCSPAAPGIIKGCNRELSREKLIYEPTILLPIQSAALLILFASLARRARRSSAPGLSCPFTPPLLVTGLIKGDHRYGIHVSVFLRLIPFPSETDSLAFEDKLARPRC